LPSSTIVSSKHKGHVRASKSSVSAITGIRGIKDPGETIKSPFKTGSTLNDLNSDTNEIYE
jgi:hypothetical protein